MIKMHYVERGQTWPCIGMLIAALALTALGCADEVAPELQPDSGVPASDTLITSDSAKTPLPAKVIILHTNDMHDHLMGFGPSADYTPATLADDTTQGGFARLASQILEERQAAGPTPVLLLDAGDFTMGSLFSWLGPSHAPMLSLMHEVGYDAITLGNHEFDWTPDGLAGTLAAAVAQGFGVPVVASNMVLSPMESGDDNLEQLSDAGVIVPRLVKTLDNGLKVGIFGLMGSSAAANAALASPVTFADAVEVARQQVSTLREQEKVDLVICLSHSGIDGQGGGEDVELAQAVPGIDVIISGHTHHKLNQPLKVGQTLIVIAGEHGAHLGKLTLAFSAEQGAQLESYELIPIDDTIAGQTSIQQTIDGYMQGLDAMLQPAGLAYDKVLAETTFDLTSPPFQEGNLGDLVTDAYRAVVEALEPGEPVVVAFEANGVLRDALRKGSSGKLRFADVYGALPMGIGPDQQPGYPLVTFYLTGNEIKQGLELLANAQDVLADNDYFLQVSGVTVAVDPTAPPFDRVKSVVRDDAAATAIDLTDTTTCHKVATNYYLATALQLVSMATGGALTVAPKEADCQTPVAEMATRIVDRDPASEGVQELKQWQALIQYLSLLPDIDGNAIPDIPQSYAAPQGRIVMQ